MYIRKTREEVIKKLISIIKEPLFIILALAVILILGAYLGDWKWLIVILTPTVLYYNYSVNKKSDRRKGILDILSMFSSRDVLEGTKKLYELKNSMGESSNQETKEEVERSNIFFANLYNNEIKEDPKFHHQRRTVTHFWVALAILLKHRLIDSKIIFEMWSNKDVEIVEMILIPLENELSMQNYHFKLPNDHPLHYIKNNKDKFYKGI